MELDQSERVTTSSCPSSSPEPSSSPGSSSSPSWPSSSQPCLPPMGVQKRPFSVLSQARIPSAPLHHAREFTRANAKESRENRRFGKYFLKPATCPTLANHGG